MSKKKKTPKKKAKYKKKKLPAFSGGPIVMLGNPFDGMKAFGPFCDYEEALEWVGNDSDEWWIVDVHNPD